MYLLHLNSYVNAFTELFFPRICYGCGAHLFSSEQEICKRCIRRLPRTGFELVDDDPVSQIFWGRVKLEKATSLYYYRKGEMLQQLLHRLKYKGNHQMGQVLGTQMGNVLSQSGFMVNIDMIIPVPLHEKKLKQRGYNQSEHIAIGLSQASGVEVVKNRLVRTIHTESQTLKGRFERWENVSSIFSVTNPESLNGKHILIIDDVVTTGATLEACVQAVLQNSRVKVSVATVGYADL